MDRDDYSEMAGDAHKAISSNTGHLPPEMLSVHGDELNAIIHPVAFKKL